MATNYVGEGKILTVTAGGAVAVGSLQVVGDVAGIAMTAAAASGDVYTLGLEGIFTIDKTSGTAWNQGDAIDWDASAGEFHKGVTPAAGDVVSAGIAPVAAGSADTTAQLKLLSGALASAVT